MKDYSKYRGNELKYIKEVLGSGKLTSTVGNFTYRFEQEFAKSFNAKYAIACNSGTSALHMGLEGLGVEYGDEVIIPALSVIMNTTSVLHQNAIPVYADVDEKTFTIDPEDVRKKVTNKTRAIVFVSLYGYPSKIEELKKIAKGIPILEDNCEHLGDLRGEIAVYSLEGTKHFVVGEMGVVLTNNEESALKVRKLGNHGFVTTKADNGITKSNISLFQDLDFKRHNSLGWNYRGSEIQSAMALAQIERKEEIIVRHRKYAGMLREIFDKYNELFIIQEDHIDHTYWCFSVRFLESKEKWREFYKKYVNNGADGFWGCWSVQYLEPVIRDGIFKYRCPDIYKNVNYEKGLCLVAEKIQSQIMQFKLNYRNEKLFEKQVFALEKTLKEI